MSFFFKDLLYFLEVSRHLLFHLSFLFEQGSGQVWRLLPTATSSCSSFDTVIRAPALLGRWEVTNRFSFSARRATCTRPSSEDGRRRHSSEPERTDGGERGATMVIIFLKTLEKKKGVDDVRPESTERRLVRPQTLFEFGLKPPIRLTAMTMLCVSNNPVETIGDEWSLLCCLFYDEDILTRSANCLKPCVTLTLRVKIVKNKNYKPQNCILLSLPCQLCASKKEHLNADKLSSVAALDTLLAGTHANLPASPMAPLLFLTFKSAFFVTLSLTKRNIPLWAAAAPRE